MLDYKLAVLLILILLASVSVLISVRKPRNVAFTFNLFELFKRIENSTNDEEKLESHNLVRSLFINIVAGFLSVIIMLSVNTSFYSGDLKDIEKAPLVNQIINKYNADNKIDAINIINSKIEDNEKDWQRLAEPIMVISIGGSILLVLFIITLFKDQEVENLYPNIFIELSTCLLAFGVFTGIFFLDVNSYIFAIILSGCSFITMAIAFLFKR